MARTIDIEQLLIWAYRDECVDKVGSGRVGPSSAVTASIYEMGALGTRVSGGGQVVTSLPEDALTVEAAVNRLGTEERLMVIRHAAAGTRPDWKITPSTGVILVDEAGDPLPQRRQERRKPTMLWSAAGHAVGCRVRFGGTTLDEAYELWLDWMVWQGALASLDDVFRSRRRLLRTWELASFDLPRMPWLQDASVPRAFASQVFLTRRKNVDTLPAR